MLDANDDDCFCLKAVGYFNKSDEDTLIFILLVGDSYSE